MKIDRRYVQAELARRSLKEFVKLCWSEVVQGSPFVDSWYIDVICDHLENLPDLRRLIINIPPRHGKSLLVAVFFPVWLWIARPELRTLAVSYSKELAIRDNLYCRRLIESKTFQQFFGGSFKLCDDQNRRERFDNDKTGFRMAGSVESPIIGEGADLLIFDDPNNLASVHQEYERKKVVDFWRNVLSSRLNNPRTGWRLIVQQRGHADDMSGYLLQNSDDWNSLVLPLEYDPDHVTYSNDPRKEKGELLTQRIPKDEVDFLKRSIGPSNFEAVYNQNPRPHVEGSLFKGEWFRYWEDLGDRYRLGDRFYAKRDCWRFATTDIALSEKQRADFTVFQVWDHTPDSDLILVHQHRDKINGAKVVEALKSLYQHWKPDFLAMESGFHWTLFIRQARDAGLTVKAIDLRGDKVARSFGAQIRMETGSILFPKDSPFVSALEDELLAFPLGRHDDQVDTLTLAATVANTYGPRVKPQAEEKPNEEEARAKAYYELLWSE